MELIRIILILSIFTMLGVLTIVSAESTPTTYITYVDNSMGFYKVRDIVVPTHKFDYENRVLNINQGDTVIWQNDAEKTTFTIVSNQGLWDRNVGYLRVDQKINYKFDKPGTYNFYIKENVDAKQTIIVNDIYGTKTSTITPTPTISHTVSNTPVPTVIGTQKPSGVDTNISSNTPFKSNTTVFSDIFGKLPIKVTSTFILSMGVAISCLIMMFLAWKNKI